MAKEYTGIDRRNSKENGRRSLDRCARCDVLWTANSEEKKNSREVCKETIDHIEHRIEVLEVNMIGKYWGRIIVAGLMLLIGFIGFQQHWAFNSILKNQSDFQLTINGVENKQISIAEKIPNIEKEIQKLQDRQDILRNMNMKILENQQQK